MRTVRLGDICLVESGGTPSRKAAANFGGNIPWVKIGDMLQGTIMRTEEAITEQGLLSSSAKVWPIGTLLVSIFATIGRTAVLGIPASSNQAIAGLQVASSKTDTSYLRHYLDSSVQALAASGRGIAQNNINMSMLRNWPVPAPPLDEQKRIAAILDKADELRTKRREALAHLDTLTQSIFHSTFDPFLLTNRATVGDTGIVQLGRQRAPKYQSGKHTRPYMRVANVKLNRLDLSDVLRMDFDEKDFKAYQLNHGDILLNEGQSTELVGRPALWRNEIKDCCFQNTLVRYVADPRLIIPEFALATFLYYFHRGEFAKISSKTSSIAHLGAARFARMPMPTPPLELQQTFATRVAAVERLKEIHRKHLAELDALFASLQHRAFKGEL